jgi:hypothetical protein
MKTQLNTMGYSTKFYHFSSSLAIPIKMLVNHPHVHSVIKGMGFPEPLHVGSCFQGGDWVVSGLSPPCTVTNSHQ